MNLVHYSKAGTEPLRQFYLEQLNEILEEQKKIANKLNLKKTLGPEVQAQYYSSWDYLAVNILISIPGFQTQKNVSEKLGLSIERTSEVLHFLEQNGLARKVDQKYEIGESGFHLGAGSPFLVKHHTNWRVQCIRSLDDIKSDDLHYSSVISCSQKDVPKIRDAMVSAIDKIRKIVKESDNIDTMMSYCLDLFPVQK